MDAPVLTWKKLPDGKTETEVIAQSLALITPGSFDASIVDAGSDSLAQEFYLWNNYKPTNNTYGQMIVSSITSGATLSGKYFDISSTTTNYRLWFNVSGQGSVAPPANLRTLVQVDITVNDTADTVATAISTRINNAGATPNLSTSLTATHTGGTSVVTINSDVYGSCRTPSQGTTSFSVAFGLSGSTPITGSGGTISNATQMQLTAVDLAGFGGIADGSQAVLKVQFCVSDGVGGEEWGAFNSDTGAFQSSMTVGGVTVPNAYYASIGNGTNSSLNPTKIYPRSWSSVNTNVQTLNGAFNAGELATHKDNYAKIRLVVSVNTNADAGQLDWLSRATYSYT